MMSTAGTATLIWYLLSIPLAFTQFPQLANTTNFLNQWRLGECAALIVGAWYNSLVANTDVVQCYTAMQNPSLHDQTMHIDKGRKETEIMMTP